MELRQLTYFLAAAQTQNFRNVSTHIYYQKTGISFSIYYTR